MSTTAAANRGIMSVNQKRLLRSLLLSGLTALAIILCTPVLTAAGIRAWIWWETRNAKVQCKVGHIEAPFLRPVELKDVHLSSDREVRLDVTAPRVTLALHLGSILRMRGHSIRQLTAENVHCVIHRNQAQAFVTPRGWSDLERLLPDSFSLTNCDLRFENGTTNVLMNGVTISGNAVQNGRFGISQASIATPYLQRRFTDLRGATSWQDDHLTISAVTLASGLDLRSLRIDLSQLREQRLALELDLDAFRGKVRANLSDDWSGAPSNWNIAGSANDLSLAQTSQSLGFTDEIKGLVHACKFTFRGNSHDPKQATASIWTELTQLSWRNRAADVIMIGASLYNQQVQLQQFYVRQSANQLNLSGEAVFPAGNFDWFNPNFSGNISASIADLGAFANLFGAHPGDFAGKVAVEGTINASDRKFGGHLTAAGGALSIFKTQFETLAAKFTLTSNAFQIEQLELHRQKDFLRAEGTIDLQGEHSYSGKASLAAEKIADYSAFLPPLWRSNLRNGQVSAEWTGRGKSDGHFGNVKMHGEKLTLAWKSEIAPFAAEIEAEYSPAQTFFRQMHFINAHASLNGFATVAARYLQLQGLALDLNGKPVLRGNLFLPVEAGPLLGFTNHTGVTATVFGGLVNSPDEKADIDLNVEETDLRELSQAVFGRERYAGRVAARVSAFGSIGALQGWADCHGKNIKLPDESVTFSFDSEDRFASGNMDLKATVTFAGSDLVHLDGNVPLGLTGTDASADAHPFAINIDAPALFATHLPRFLTRDFLRDGILSGKVSVVGPWPRPAYTGDVQLTNGKFNPLRAHLSDASGRVVLQGRKGNIEFVNVGQPPLTLGLRGSVDFSDPDLITMQLSGVQPLVILSPLADSGPCLNGFRIEPPPAPDTAKREADQISIAGGWKSGWNVTLSGSHLFPGANPPAVAINSAVMPLCLDQSEGAPLLIASDAPAGGNVEKAKPSRKKSRRRR